ncbi:histidine kinase [Kribbella sp. NPDC050470]|uniref:histidine kinase n=1 Tax=unclassified Kribbella TaxID=2644121 RepID=UPI0037ADCBF9
MRRGLMLGATAVCVASWAVLAVAAFGPSDARDEVATLADLLVLVPLGLSWLIAVRVPASPVGPALAWLAAFLVATPAVESWGDMSGGVVAVIGAGVWAWQLVGFLILLLVFPDGLRWKALFWLVPIAAALMTAAFVVTMNYHDVPPAHSPVAVPEALWMPVMLGALGIVLAVSVACIASVVVRYRHGDQRTRQQLRWLILAAGAVVVLMVASWVVTAFGWVGQGAYAGFLLGIVVLVPAAVTIAILRHDLFEIDRILSDSVAWVVTAVVAALMTAGLVIGIGYLAGRDSAAGLTASVFLVALALLPLHRWFHKAVGRVIDRDRVVLLERIRRFVDQVRDGSAEPETVEQVLRDAVGDPQLSLLLTSVEDGRYVDLAGEPVQVGQDAVQVPLRTTDTDIGLVLVGDASARQLRRVQLAASAARLPIEVSRLRLGLRRALQEVDDSRNRIVAATVAERHRLERDLHDGAQQQLLAIGMQLQAAQRQLPPEHPVLSELDVAVERLEQTVRELRRLAHGVRPASLDDGLATALRRLAPDSPIPIHFAVPDVVPPELIATTAYFVVAEAVANVLKHAQATRIDVVVREADNQLHVSVTDDGVGGTPSNGLVTLRDRVDSVGGRLTISSPAQSGTAIEVVLPCVS